MHQRIRHSIPSFFTLINLSCGFMAILIADFHKSSILLLISLLCDSLDGFAARKLNATSEMGKELDSLADLTSFGIAPAYLYFMIADHSSIWHYIAPLLIVIGSALRLAKFNLMPPSKFFSGLPTPATALFLIGMFLAHHYGSSLVNDCLQNTLVYIFIPAFLCLMMISRLQMFSLKSLDKNMAKNKFHLALIFVFIILLLIDNLTAPSITVLVYILLSAVQTFIKRG